VVRELDHTLIWIWSLQRFWTFTPWGWVAAVFWNVLERTNAWRVLPDGLTN
jgi:hypothetical protein